MATRCVCQICTCGRHKCQLHPGTRTTKPSGACPLSEYRDTYRNQSVPRTLPIKPDDAPKFSNEPVDDKTTHNTTYIPHPIQLHTKREKDLYVRPQGDIEKTSSYNFDYIPHRSFPAASAKPLEKYMASQKPFEDGTSYNNTYIPWDLQGAKVKSMKPEHRPKSGNAKMDSKSTHQMDFPGHYGARTNAINPPAPALRISSGHMEHDTTTRADYTKKDVRPRTAMKPVYDYPTDRPPLDDMTTVNRDFKWLDGRPATSFKPPAALVTSDVPFQGDTSYKNTFKQWPLSKREMKQKEVYQPPTGKFEGTTSFQRDYVKHPLCRAKMTKPDMYAHISKQPFDDSTEHNEKFKQWQVGLPDRARRPDNYNAPTTKFEGQTNYQTHYTGDYAPPAETVRPSVSKVQKGNMNFDTSYKTTYRGERPPSCPAKYLSSTSIQLATTNNYTYDHSSHGHTYYRSGLPQYTGQLSA